MKMDTFYLTTLEDGKKVKIATAHDCNISNHIADYCRGIYADEKKFLVTVKQPYKAERKL